MNNTTTHSPVPQRFSGAWETKRLGSIGRCLRGVSYDPTTDLASYDKEGTVRLLRANNVQDAVVTVTDIQYVESHRVADFQVMQPDDILICMANGSKALVGKAGLFRIRDGYTYAFGAFMGCFRVDSTLADARFVFYLLQTGEFRDYIGLVLAGSSINNLKPSDIEEAGFRLPARDEQTAIADVLSDLDAAIDASDALIAKKRAVKQSAMQQLLTGETRLPGFSGEWETKRLRELGPFLKGRGIKRDDVSYEGLPCVRYGELYTRYENYIVAAVSRIPPSVALTALPIATGDLLFAGSGETAEEIGRCAAYVEGEQTYAGGDVIVLRPAGQNSVYLGHLMNSPIVSVQKARMGQGDAIVHISTKNLAQVEIKLPPLAEQTAIAAILLAMDAEIEALERRRDKVRAIMQGMMQELLTGRVRLAKSA